MSCFLNQYTWYFHFYKNNIFLKYISYPHREKFLRKLYKNKYIKLYSLEKCKLYVNLHRKIKNECPRLPTHPANIIFIPRDNQITRQAALACWLLLYGCLWEFADTRRFSHAPAELCVLHNSENRDTFRDALSNMEIWKSYFIYINIFNKYMLK